MLRKWIVGVLVAMVLLGVVIPGSWLWWHGFRPLPSDASLKSRFSAHRSDFDSLAAMALADTQLVRAAHDPMLMRFTVFVHDNERFDRMLPETEVQATGRAGLRRLIDRAGVPSLSRTGDEVRFVVRSNWGKGRKGYIYSPRELKPLRQSLDELGRTSAGLGESGYVPLAPRWFLFLEPTD